MDRFGDLISSDSELELDVPFDDSPLGDPGEDHADSSPPSPVGQDERRMQVRAYNHWAGLLGDAPFPDIADLDPHTLEDFGPFSVLLDFSAGVEDPGVRFLGRELASECGAQDIAMLSDVPARSLLSRITDHYMQILANQAPIGFEAEFVNERGNTALYRGILLPYSSDAETIDFIYGVINWKEVADRDTADALLLEIGQALGIEEDAAPAPPSPTLDALLPFNRDEDQDEEAELEQRPVEDKDVAEDIEEAEDVLDLGVVASAIEDDALPMPAFGGQAVDDNRPQVPASMAPGNATDDDWTYSQADDADEEDAFDHSPIGETAQDYGLDDEWDEPDYDDVDDLVDPLADESVGEGLSALVTRGARLRPVVELPTALNAQDEQHDDEPAPVPTAYEAPVEQSHEPETSFDHTETDEAEADVPLELGVGDVYEADEDEQADASGSLELDAPAETEVFEDVPLELTTVDPQDDTVEPDVAAFADELPVGPLREAVVDQGPGEDLHDMLAQAREMAATARNSEDRTRTALYAAVGRAYDFSLEAQDDPEAFGELVADAGLTVQDRAPMTPVVKLVFGSDYDKTRLTEYAAVLTHAHRVGLERGALAPFLAAAEGGLKGVVSAERRARKEEAGKPVEDGKGVRAALADKLRGLDAVALEDLPADGPEFALVMVRRNADGAIELVGELPEDVPMIEKAARVLVA